ncbi:MAG TPA: hypothetical protein ENG48_05145 [Candidatus Atribacteria bacterium]|nr:hypothetical protein [Candidatus Atribacteria bacterium]
MSNNITFAHALKKVKETILNGKWDSYWKKQRNHPIKLTPPKPALSASCFTQEGYSSPIIQARIPALDGPHQDKPWVVVLGLPESRGSFVIEKSTYKNLTHTAFFIFLNIFV